MTSFSDPPFVLLSPTLPSAGGKADVYLRDGFIERIVPLSDGTGRARHYEAERNVEFRRLDLSGYVLLPSPVEPHAHLDKALLGRRVTNSTGDLAGAITAAGKAYPSMVKGDVERRALAALAEAIAHGFTAIRTHVDCREENGTTGIEAMVDLRRKLKGTVDLQIVALAGKVAGKDGRANRSALVRGLELGADLVGGAPSLEGDSDASLQELFAIATDARCGIDVHIDETTDPNVFVLRQLAERVLASGFRPSVTASHCVSLGMQKSSAAAEVILMIAAAGISVVALPQTNLFLQGREAPTRKPRGLTAIRELMAAGVNVAAGGDNWRDPFNPMGRIDAMETASLLVSAGHLTVGEAFACISTDARAVMGLPEVRLAAGYPADLVAMKAPSLEEAVASGTADRLVFKTGRLLAQTEVATTLYPALPGQFEETRLGW